MWSDVAHAIPGLLTAVAVLVAAVQLWISRVQARGEVEQRYIDRYWKLSDETALGSSDQRGLDLVQAKRYWRLCEDEFEWTRLGQVRPRTWAVWPSAIRAAIGPFAKADLGSPVCAPDGSDFFLLR
ncbi:MAG: hypothetical protein ACR2GB_05975, partial [Nocardioidaceae bacterium]